MVLILVSDIDELKSDPVNIYFIMSRQHYRIIINKIQD